MSILARKVARLEAARATVAQLEKELAHDLGLVRRGGRPGAYANGAPEGDGAEPVPRKRRKRVRLTPELEADIIARCKVPGAMKVKVADDLGISVQTVYRAVASYREKTGDKSLSGAPLGRPRPSILTPELLEKLRVEAAGNRPVKEQQRLLGISSATYYKGMAMLKESKGAAPADPKPAEAAPSSKKAKTEAEILKRLKNNETPGAIFKATGFGKSVIYRVGRKHKLLK